MKRIITINKISDYIKDGVDVFIKIDDYSKSETLMKVLDYIDDQWPSEPIETAIDMCLDEVVSKSTKELILSVDKLDNATIRIIENNSIIVNVENHKTEIYLSIEDRLN